MPHMSASLSRRRGPGPAVPGCITLKTALTLKGKVSLSLKTAPTLRDKVPECAGKVSTSLKIAPVLISKVSESLQIARGVSGRVPDSLKTPRELRQYTTELPKSNMFYMSKYVEAAECQLRYFRTVVRSPLIQIFLKSKV